MSMSVNGIGSVTQAYTGPTQTSAQKAEEEKKQEREDQAAIYEKGTSDTKQATYSKESVKSGKASEADRAKIVQQMVKRPGDVSRTRSDALGASVSRAEADAARQNQLIELVNKTLSGQANAYGKAGNIWQRLRSGDFTVDAATKAQAQADIGENGYYGVKQTSQRLFDFAKALAGDDVEKMKKMQSAMEKGFKQAEKTWGGKLPSICQDTIDSARKLFDDYFER